MTAARRLAWMTWPRRLLSEWLAACILATALAMVLLFSGASARLDNVAYDAVLRAMPRAADPRILIVAIDDRSLSELGGWPWSRRTHAALVDRLSAAGAHAIAYDVLFVEPSREPGADADLARAITASARVCLPVLIEAPGRNGADFQLTPPVTSLTRATAGLGHVDLDYDADGISRRAGLSEAAGGRAIPHLMRCVLKPTKPPLPNTGTLERTDTALIPYGGGPGRFPTVSAASIVRGETPDAFLKDRLILVGATATGLHDRHSTPVSTRNEAMSGIEVQANLLEGLLSGRFIRPASPWSSSAYTLALIWVFLASLLIAPPRYNLILGFGVVSAAVAFSAATLMIARIWLPPSPAVLTLLVVFPLWGWRRLEAASAYMVEELARFAAEPDVLAPGGHAIVGGDVLERRIGLMHHAVQRARDLRAYAATAARQREHMVELLSHDIRSPQSSILAVLEAREVPVESARRIAGYARRTLDLADNFVSLAKVDSGALSLEVINLSDLVTEALDEIWPLAQRARVRLSSDGVDDEYLVSGDRSLLGRALTNLLDNAIKFSPEGGMVTTTLKPAMLGDAVAVDLRITDQGPGVDPDQRLGLFERFERAGGREAKGIGLGLTLVAQVAQRHGGRVAYVDGGPGASFVLTLPLVP